MSDDSSSPPPSEAVAPGDGDARPRVGAASLALFGLLICAAIFRVGYSVLMHRGLGQGMALFIGLPVLLGTVVVFTTYPRSPVGLWFKVTTLVLCIIAPLMGEGAICIVMAAPLIFGMIGLGALITWLLSPKVGRGKASCCAALLGVVPLLWEPAQKTAGWEERRPVEEVRDAIELSAAPDAVWQALAYAAVDPQAAPVPGFMQLRWRPGTRKVVGTGLAVGSTRDIYFDQDHYIGRVVRSEPGREVVFAVSETEAGPGERIALWLRFVEVRFVLQDLGGGRTRLEQTTRYRRLLDPALYFAPLERLGVHAMHRYTLALLTQGLRAS